VKILITGGGGFLGLNIAKLLKDDGHTVYSFSRKNHPALNALKIETLKGDITNYQEVQQAFIIGFDGVIHTASKIGMWGCKKDFETINITGTKNIITACREFSVRSLVYTSTPSVVFGNSSLIEASSNNTPYPKKHLNDYARTKCEAEKLVLATNCDHLKTTALRPHLIMGSGDPHLLPGIIEATKKGRIKIIGDGTNRVDIVSVKNAAKAHTLALYALDSKRDDICGRPFFITQKESVQLWPFINKLLQQNNMPEIKKKIPVAVAYHIGHVIEILFKILRLLRLFNIDSKNPPMTRFIALQLGTSHYFKKEESEVLGDYRLQTTEELMKELICK